MKPGPSQDPVEWVRRVNRRWIVRQGLADAAEAWLDHLQEKPDPRLRQVCENARSLVLAGNRLEDPKPWFYAGLFSLATATEARHFLGEHHFTAAALPVLASDPVLEEWIRQLAPPGRDLLRRLRLGIAGL